jgi:ERF superfamily
MEEKKTNIYAKLVAIRSALGLMKKDGKNEHFNYKYVTEAQVTFALKEQCDIHKVFIAVTCEHMNVQAGLTTINMKYTMIDAENPDSRYSVEIPGAATDKGDKGLYKAFSGSAKYFAMKNFLLATDDDPERQDKEKIIKEKKEKAMTPGQERTLEMISAGKAYIYDLKPILDTILTEPEKRAFKIRTKVEFGAIIKEGKMYTFRAIVDFYEYLLNEQELATANQKPEANIDTDDLPDSFGSKFSGATS